MNVILNISEPKSTDTQNLRLEVLLFARTQATLWGGRLDGLPLARQSQTRMTSLTSGSFRLKVAVQALAVLSMSENAVVRLRLFRTLVVAKLILGKARLAKILKCTFVPFAIRCALDHWLSTDPALLAWQRRRLPNFLHSISSPTISCQDDLVNSSPSHCKLSNCVIVGLLLKRKRSESERRALS